MQEKYYEDVMSLPVLERTLSPRTKNKSQVKVSRTKEYQEHHPTVRTLRQRSRSPLMNRLTDQVASFIKEFKREEKMRQIVIELKAVTQKAEKKQKENTTACVIGGITSVVSIIGYPFTGGLTVPLILAGVSAISVLIDQRKKHKKKSVKKVTQLRKELTEIVKCLENKLQDINDKCEELEWDREGDLDGFGEESTPVSRLKSRIEDILSSLQEEMKVLRAIDTSTELDFINKSVDWLQKINDKVDELKKELKVLRGEK